MSAVADITMRLDVPGADVTVVFTEDGVVVSDPKRWLASTEAQLALCDQVDKVTAFMKHSILVASQNSH